MLSVPRFSASAASRRAASLTSSIVGVSAHLGAGRGGEGEELVLQCRSVAMAVKGASSRALAQVERAVLRRAQDHTVLVGGVVAHGPAGGQGQG